MATKQSKAYLKGVAAFGWGWPDDTNPYPKTGKSGQRTEWYDGWYDSRIGKNLGHIFKKHGITWP